MVFVQCLISFILGGIVGISLLGLVSVSKLSPEEEAKLEDYFNERGKARTENTEPMTKNNGPAAENESKSD